MVKNHPPTCTLCHRHQLFPEEGRLIDDFWTGDRYLIEHHGQWVCSWPCYGELLTEATVPTLLRILRASVITFRIHALFISVPYLPPRPAIGGLKRGPKSRNRPR